MPGPAADSGAGVRTDQILAAVRSRGGRTTTAKRILVTVLLASTGHRAAEDIGAAIRAHALSLTAHGHLVCENCASMKEVPSDLIAELATTAWQRYGFRIEPRRFAALGLCAACASHLAA